MGTYLDKAYPAWRFDISDDDQLVSQKLREQAVKKLTREQEYDLINVMSSTRSAYDYVTAWRLEGTLREFASFKPCHLWFNYPVHVLDDAGLLADAKMDGEEPPWKAKKASKTDERISKKRAFVDAITTLSANDAPTLDEVADYLGVKRRTIETRMKQAGYKAENGKVIKVMT